MKKIKQILAICLAFTVTFAMFPLTEITVFAEDNSNVLNADVDGDGTESNPYQIATAAQLSYVAQCVNDGRTNDKYFVQIADIDLYGMEWVPIGNKTHYFSGQYDGNGFKVSNISIESENEDIGLFGRIVGGCIKNLNIVNANISGHGNVGGIVGAAVKVYYSDYSNVSNCTVTSSKISGEGAIGGIAGYSNSIINNCSFSGSISSTGSSIGGIVGVEIGLGTRTITKKCTSTGTINGNTYVGGIAGRLIPGGADVEQCSNYATVQGDTNVGGIAGNADSGPGVRECYNAGPITGEERVGGIIGYLSQGGSIINCYNTGAIVGVEYVGGIAGHLYQNGAGIHTSYNIGSVTKPDGSTINGSQLGNKGDWLCQIKDSYFLSDNSTSTSALMLEQMASEASFMGFDFNDIWIINKLLGRPVLQNNLESTSKDFAYTVTYDTKQYYDDGGFYSSTSSMSDCVELYCLFENKIAEILKFNNHQNKFTYGSKDISPITLKATVSGSDLSFSRNNYQNKYITTFESISIGKAVDDILMLFPHKLNLAPTGNTYTVTITLESDSFDVITEQYSFTIENLSNKSVNEHIDFIRSNADYRVSKKNSYGNSMLALKNDAEYKWSKFSSFDFDNYYDIVLADIIIDILNVKQLELPSLVPEVLKDWISTYKTLLTEISKIVEDDYIGDFDLSETNIDKLMKKSKYLEDGMNVDDEVRDFVLLKVRDKVNIDKINSIFARIDKSKQILGFVKLGNEIIKDIIDWGNKISVFNAYSNADKEFKTVIEKFGEAIPDSEKKLKTAVDDYINYSTDISGKAEVLIKSMSEMLGGVSLEVFSSCIGTNLLKYLGAKTLNWIGSISIAGGATLSTTAAFSSVQTAFGSFFTGASLGLCLSDVLCDNSGKSQEMSKVIAMSEFAPYVIDAMNYFEKELLNNKTDDAVKYYEYAFALHKSTQCYIMSHTVNALKIKRDSIIIKLFGRDDYDGLISDILVQKASIDNLQCHSIGKQSSTVVINTKVVAIKCPVNVCIYDEKGNEVVRIINNVSELVADEINIFIENGEKFIALPNNQNYSVKIFATDAGVMEYVVTEYESGMQRLRTIKKSNIPLIAGRTFYGQIAAKNNIPWEDYALCYDNIKILPDNIFTEPTTGIQLNHDTANIFVGDNFKLMAEVYPLNATNQTICWYTDNPSIATVDKNGTVTAVSDGKVTIWASTEDWGYIDSCTFTILDHSFGPWTVTQKPTCTNVGEEIRICTCGEVETRVINKIAHIYSDWLITKDYACTEDGLKERLCSACGEKETAVIPALTATNDEDNTDSEAPLKTEKNSTTGIPATGDALAVGTVAMFFVLSVISGAAVLLLWKRRKVE